MKTQKKKLNGDGTVFYLEKERKWRAEITWVDGGGNKHRKSWKATKQADVKEKLAEFKRQLIKVLNISLIKLKIKQLIINGIVVIFILIK